MAQWQEVQQLEKAYLEQVHRLYSEDHLPMEVRQYLAPWLEDQNWNRAAEPPAAEPHSSQAHMLFHTLLALLDDQYSRFGAGENDFVLKHNLRKSKLNLQARYQECPEQLANVIANLLREEKAILSRGLAAQQAAAQPPASAPMETDRQQKIGRRLGEAKAAVQELDREVRHLEELQDTFDFRYKLHLMVANGAPPSPDLARQTEQLQAMLNNLDRSRKCLWQDILAWAQELLGRCETLRDFLLEELAEWKDRQRRACIGAACDTSLSCLETWFTGAAEVLFQLWRLLRALGDQHVKLTYLHDPLAAQRPLLESRLQEQLSCLLRSAFVVEIQPIMPFPNRRPLVLKTGSKFSVRARLLVKLQDRSHRLEVKIILDQHPPDVKGFRKFNILTSTSKTLVQDDPQMEGLVCDFRHISLKDQRAGASGKGSKGASEGLLAVTEELHLITFTLDYKYQELALELQTSTLPVVIISSNNQFSCAWASVLWFNMLSPDPKNLLFFSAPPAASWAQLAEVLSWQFSAATERGLDKEQLHMLAEKLFGPEATPASTLTWAKFAKPLASSLLQDNPPTFSFWTWLDGILNLIRDHLAQLWKDGHIMGFVSRKRERQLLKRKQMGTFLLRFSQSSREGGITCSWVEPGEKGQPKVRSVEPYTKVELTSLPLPDIIHDYQLVAAENIPENPLKFLYPSTPRDEAFGKYYTERREVDLLEQRKYLNRRLIRVSSRQPHEPWLPENMVAAPPAAEGLAASHLEPLEPGASHLEPLEPGASHLEPLEPGASHLEPLEPGAYGLEPGACGLEALGLGAYELESLEAGANYLEALEPGAYGLEALGLGAYGLEVLEPGPSQPEVLEPGPDQPEVLEPGASQLELLEPGASTQEVLEALKQELDLLSFDQAGSNVLRGGDPYLPPPADVPPPVLPGSALFVGANDLPPLHVDSKDFQ
ncbi:signal transducer and activator of transcription 2 isoform X1 [Gopherus flavomarginatus]|uniref:signal transducer and activator of transcription 2 isoform X1 n=1 Tax=Gopherus flavomarginatus TaxID=286002 RepID=UPI0021CBF39B|nr:signal transducer and activator of transcription 2 isoform X1 [Gopherus flavomarginatus]XP_050781516.1 signal transducer and activator of transcription 2 isoform X1 [Gopherus flavomarginatus]XP_050781517.1 signal transducer and activator of transcription 2 isoform X1 [Gopherus flavomarginatus]